jgi:hypothetical protein
MIHDCLLGEQSTAAVQFAGVDRSTQRSWHGMLQSVDRCLVLSIFDPDADVPWLGRIDELRSIESLGISLASFRSIIGVSNKRAPLAIAPLRQYAPSYACPSGTAPSSDAHAVTRRIRSMAYGHVPFDRVAMLALVGDLHQVARLRKTPQLLDDVADMLLTVPSSPHRDQLALIADQMKQLY